MRETQSTTTYTCDGCGTQSVNAAPDWMEVTLTEEYTARILDYCPLCKVTVTNTLAAMKEAPPA